MQTKPSLRSSTNSSSSGEEANPSSLMAEESNSSMGSSGSGGGGGAADREVNQDSGPPRARAWSVLLLTRNLVWHLGQVTLKSAFFGTFPSWITSLVEQNVQMMSIGLLLLCRSGVTSVQGQALDVGRLLAAGLLDPVDAALHDRLSGGVQLGGLLRDQSLRIDFDDRLIEGLHAEGNAGFLDLVEGLPLALARQDGFAGPDIVAEDVVDGDTPPAHLGQQALADDPADRVRDALTDLPFLFLVEHAQDAVDGLAGIHRVHRAQDEVAGLGCLQGQLDRLAVAHLAHEDDIRRLTERGAKAVGEGVEVAAQFSLVEGRLDVGMDELDRVLQGDDVDGPSLVELPQQSSQRSGFPDTGGAGHQDQAVLLLGHLPECVRHLEIVDGRNQGLQLPHDDRIVPLLGEDVDAQPGLPGQSVRRIP